ncbi:MAG: hypothetical protein H8D81_00030 [Deltaproteobacteria bacterium]|nr:hypothetical protein [Deltaproteobacteria bacterium]
MQKPIKWVIILFLVCILGFFAYSGLETWHNMKLQTALEQQRGLLQAKVEYLDEQVATLKEMLALAQQASEDGGKKASLFGDETKAPTQPPLKPMACEVVKRQLSSLMAYLDGKEYRELYGFSQGTAELFKEAVGALNTSMPVISGEMDDLQTLIQNVTHFYRVVGRKKVGMMADILKNETEMLEPAILALYNWATAEGRCQDLGFQPPGLETLYQYAGFFLNTLGGRSYLLRRDSKARVLAGYYSVLIIDRANDQTLNRFGIDIRPYIEISYHDIRSQRGLLHQQAYLSRIEALKTKYQM